MTRAVGALILLNAALRVQREHEPVRERPAGFLSRRGLCVATHIWERFRLYPRPDRLVTVRPERN